MFGKSFWKWSVRNKALIAFALSVPVLSIADEDPKPSDPSPKSLGVEYEFNTTSGEAIRISAQMGNETDPLKAIESASQIEKNTGDGAIEVFVNEGEESVITPRMKAEFEKFGVVVDPIVIPRSVTEKLKSARNFLRAIYVPPKRRDWTIGLILGGMRTGVTAGIWFSAPGVSNELALTMTAIMGSITTSHTVLTSTMQNLFLKGVKNPTSVKGKLLIASKNILYDGILSNIVNMIAGWHINPLQYNLSLAPTLVVGGVHSMTKNLLTKGSRYLNVAYGLVTMPIFYFLQGLENSGAISAIAKIGMYEVKPSIIATLTIYGGLIAGNLAAPNTMKKFWEKVNKPVDRFLSFFERGQDRLIALFKKRTEKYCDNVLRRDPLLEEREVDIRSDFD